MENYFVHFLGIFATVLTLGSLMLKSDLKMRYAISLGSFIWCFHFFYIGAITSCVIFGIMGVRQLSSIYLAKKSKNIKIGAAVFFVLLSTGMVAYTWQGAMSILPWIASTNTTIAFIVMSGWKLRRQILISDIFNAANGIVVGSWESCLTFVIAIIINAFTIRAIRKDEVKVAQEQEQADQLNQLIVEPIPAKA